MSSPTDYRIVLCEGRTLLGVGPRRWWWRLESTANGKTLAHSETYTTRAKQEQTAQRFGDATGVTVTVGDA